VHPPVAAIAHCLAGVATACHVQKSCSAFTVLYVCNLLDLLYFACRCHQQPWG
jgi:hypothetical protein